MHVCFRLQLSRKAMLPKLLSVEDAELRLRKAFKPVTTDTPVGGSQVGLACTPAANMQGVQRTWHQLGKAANLAGLHCRASKTQLSFAVLQALKRKLMARKLFVPWGSTTPLAVQRQPVQSQAMQTPVDQKVGCQHSR